MGVVGAGILNELTFIYQVKDVLVYIYECNNTVFYKLLLE